MSFGGGGPLTNLGGRIQVEKKFGTSEWKEWMVGLNIVPLQTLGLCWTEHLIQ